MGGPHTAAGRLTYTFAGRVMSAVLGPPVWAELPRGEIGLPSVVAEPPCAADYGGVDSFTYQSSYKHICQYRRCVLINPDDFPTKGAHRFFDGATPARRSSRTIRDGFRNRGTRLVIAAPRSWRCWWAGQERGRERRPNLAISILYTLSVAGSCIGETWSCYLIGSTVEAEPPRV